MVTRILIANQVWNPGQLLSLNQMLAIQTSIDLNTEVYTNAAPGSLQAQAYQQYLSQGGREFIASALQQRANNSGTDSAGQVVAEEAQARAEGAATSNPVAPTSVLAPNGRINPDNLETGINDPVRTQTSTQSTPPASNGNALPFVQTGTGLNILPEDLAALEEPYVVTQPGAAANRDDNTRPNTNTTSQAINASFNQRIVPRKNILDQYASYTYNISWYLLTPDQYNEMTTSQKKNTASWQLLVQSSGASTQVAGVNANSTATAGRNQFFSLDYYLDNLEIESKVPLKGTGAADGRLSIKFTVTEPNGITLIENLYKAVSNLYKQNNITNIANYPLAQYCLVIRFYGYDENGNMINTGQRGTNGNANFTDPRAVNEKFYPFVIEDLKFRIPKERVVEYTIQGKPIPHFYNKSQDRGTIPFNFELTGETVEQILRGKSVSPATGSVTDGRKVSPQPNTSAPTQPNNDSDITGQTNQNVGGGTTFGLGVGA